MSYQVTWKAGASRDMDRLPLAIAAAVLGFIYGPLARVPEEGLVPHAAVVLGDELQGGEPTISGVF
jgi:hypothetical protein